MNEMKNLVVLCCLWFSAAVSGQSVNQVEMRVADLESQITKQAQLIDRLSDELEKDYWTYRGVKQEVKDLLSLQRSVIDSLIVELEANRTELEASKRELADAQSGLSSRIDESEQEAIGQFASIEQKGMQYTVFGSVFALLLGLGIYLVLRKTISTSKSDVEVQIRNTKVALEEEAVKLDGKLIEVLETQLKLSQVEPVQQSRSDHSAVDHSLALRVADEIIRIQRNLQQMDQGTKGLKQLHSSVNRIQDNFSSNGYELVDMLGKEYNEGMKVTANLIPSDELEPGKQLITRIIKPQVNFQGTMIQGAQIEVSVGE